MFLIHSQMIELDINAAVSRVKEVKILRGADMVANNMGEYGAVCLVVRRPGCMFCREQAFTLSVLAAMRKDLFEGVGFFAIVKETGVDDEGLSQFHDKYFSFPTYRDQSWTFYEALGNRKLGLSVLLNRATVSSIICETFQRFRQKEGDGSAKGDGLVQGGIIFFGNDGRPKYAYQEETGMGLRVRDIIAAITAIKKQHSSGR